MGWILIQFLSLKRRALGPCYQWEKCLSNCDNETMVQKSQEWWVSPKCRCQMLVTTMNNESCFSINFSKYGSTVVCWTVIFVTVNHVRIVDLHRQISSHCVSDTQLEEVFKKVLKWLNYLFIVPPHKYIYLLAICIIYHNWHIMIACYIKLLSVNGRVVRRENFCNVKSVVAA
jgi:hypothetical protein